MDGKSRKENKFDQVLEKIKELKDPSEQKEPDIVVEKKSTSAVNVENGVDSVEGKTKAANDESNTMNESNITNPDVGEYGIDLKKVREVEKMFEIKMIKKGLTLQEKQLKSSLENKRALYEMDRYVNISQVHEIVKDSLMELYDKLQASHKLARENREETKRMD